MKKLSHLLILFVSGISSVFAQSLVASFVPPVPITSAYISTLETLADGKIIVAGDLEFYGKDRVYNLIRLNADGTLDNTFDFHPANYDDFGVTDVEVLSSGKMIVLTYKYSFNPTYAEERKIYKVNADGSIESERVTPISARSIVVRDNGKILLGGYSPVRIIQYNSDLTEDDTFNNAVSFDGFIGDIKQVGSQTLISGYFTMVNGVSKNSLVMLNSNGSIDPSFDIGSGTTDFIGDLTIQSDGKILLGTTYINSFNGVPCHGALRLNKDGSIDEGFNPPYVSGIVSKMVVSGNSVYAGSYFDGDSKLFRMDMNGTIDESFSQFPLDFGGDVKISVASNGLIVNSTRFSGNVFGLSKLTNAGNVDNSFAPEVGRFGTIAICNQHNGKLVVAGDFIRINGVATYGVAVLNLDGTLDESFKLKNNKGAVSQLKIQDDDNILITTYKYFFKVNKYGDEIPEFNWTSPFQVLYEVIKFEELPSGQIVAGDANGISRLNADGSGDESFEIKNKCCWNSTAFDFDMQGDKVIYGSLFSQIGGVDVNNLVRLNTDGSADPTFQYGKGPKGDSEFDFVTFVKALDNNEVLVGGAFNEFSGFEVKNRLVKLKVNGAIDTAFVTNQQAGPSINYLFDQARAIQIGSKVFIKGVFNIYAVNVDGTVDEDFQVPVNIDAISDLVSLEDLPDGRRENSDGTLYAFGSFKLKGSNVPTSLIKISLEPQVIAGTENSVQRESDISIFPNPVKETLKFKVKEKSNFTASVMDMSGQVQLNTKQLGTYGNEIDVRTLPGAMYILKVVSESGKISFGKFLKTQ